MSKASTKEKILDQPTIKFYILEPTKYISDLLETNENQIKASSYYKDGLNEESAEIWLHRSFRSMSYEDGYTQDPSEADIFLIAGYAHLSSSVTSQRIDSTLYLDLIVDPTKPHLLLMPTTNPGVSQRAGIENLAKSLQNSGVNVWSVGFERNPYWQGVDVEHILPIPYVVRMIERSSNATDSAVESIPRISNFVFYAGNPRPHAGEWGGCFRKNITDPLSNEPNMFVKTLRGGQRLTQERYNEYMQSSDYCLIVCGDTPTSRSLTTAMILGCIPIRVGSRLRGLCDPPCFDGWGWTVTGGNYSHLAYENHIPWRSFPEVAEMDLIKDGVSVLNTEIFGKYDQAEKDRIRHIMEEDREGFIYGWGDPVKSMDFGGAYRYILDSFQSVLSTQ